MSELGEQALRVKAALEAMQEATAAYVDERRRYDELMREEERDLREVEAVSGQAVRVRKARAA